MSLKKGRPCGSPPRSAASRAQALAAGLQRREILLAAHRELAEADLLRLLQRVADDAEGVLGQLVVRARRSRACRSRAARSRRRRRTARGRRSSSSRASPVEILVVEQHVVALLVLEALDDLVGIDRPDARRRPSGSGSACRTARGSAGRRSSRWSWWRRRARPEWRRARAGFGLSRSGARPWGFLEQES